MNRTEEQYLKLLMLLFFSCVLGCTEQGDPPPPRFDAHAIGRAAMVEFDKNRDGKIAGSELDGCPGLKAAVDQIDRSGLGEITAEKIAARIGNWEDSHIGAIAISFSITHNGSPMANADIRLVPEKFLGDSANIATGKTDTKGVARINREPPYVEKLQPGVALGFYRIEITKSGEDIPAKYNANTILGLEVAIDSKGIPKTLGDVMKIDLEY